MIRLQIQNIIDSTGAELLRGDANSTAVGVSTDTRSLDRGAFFVALSGPNFDGNRFALDAERAGAGGLMLRGTGDELRDALAAIPGEVPVLAHVEPRRALSDLASWHRSRLSAPVVGITGSCGKTTTKNILAELLGSARRIVASPNSFNNDIGVPHTLFLADDSTEALVVEMGTNHPGEIAALCRTARPTAGVITNIGASHLEGLLSVEGVAREKGELAACLPRDGFCVLNADCPWTPTIRAMTTAPVITFSVEGDGDLDARDPWFHAGGTTFRLDDREITFPLLGRHNVQNLLAALATCRGLGVELDDVLPALENLSDGHRRMERHDVGGVALYDDTYNANPDSARASVRVLAGLHGFRRRVLVLGDMLELGEFAAEMHHQVGVHAAKNGIDQLVLVGELCRATAAGALEGGLPADRIHHTADVTAATDVVRELVTEGDVVLVKGSRAVGLDRLVGAMLEQGA